MARLTRRESLDLQLDRKISELDALARDQGHSPGEWTIVDGQAANAYCLRCGRSAAVRLMDGGARVWAHRLPAECKPKEERDE